MSWGQRCPDAEDIISLEAVQNKIIRLFQAETIAGWQQSETSCMSLNINKTAEP